LRPPKIATVVCTRHYVQDGVHRNPAVSPFEPDIDGDYGYDQAHEG